MARDLSWRGTWIHPKPFRRPECVLLVQPAAEGSCTSSILALFLPPSPAIHPAKSRVVRVYGTCLVAAWYHVPYFREDLLYEGIKEQESVTFPPNRITYFWRGEIRGWTKKNFVVTMVETMAW